MTSSDNRNVLIVVVDQLRADCLHLKIAGKEVTPNLNAFASDAVTFSRNYSVVNPCGPSRASLLTGMYAMNHRSVRNGTPLRHDIGNLARHARTHGYEPLLFGYSDTTGDPRHVHPNDPDIRGYERVLPGFNEILEMRQTNDSYPWRAYLKGKGYDLPPYERFYVPDKVDPARGPRPDDPAFYSAQDSDTAFLADSALSQLAVRTDNEWFAFVSFIRPHPPIIAPEPYNRMHDPNDVADPIRVRSSDLEASIHPFVAASLKLDSINDFVDADMGLDNEDRMDFNAVRSVYFGLASEVDRHIGRMIDFLKSTDQYDNTLVVITADHGEMLGDRRQWGKMSCFDAAFHTPLLVRDPARTDRNGSTVEAFTESVDIAPTILDWISGSVPVHMDGRSLLRFFESDSEQGWRDCSYSEIDFGDPETPTVWQRELGIDLREANLAILREKNLKLVHFNGGLPPLLFDMSADDGEMRNLAGNPARAADLLRMTRRLLDHRMKFADHTLSDMKVTGRGTINYAPSPNQTAEGWISSSSRQR